MFKASIKHSFDQSKIDKFGHVKYSDLESSHHIILPFDFAGINTSEMP